MIKNFFDISDLDKSILLSIINSEANHQLLNGKNIGLIFEKASTRTRLSFQVGISQLGGNAINIRYEELNISREESFEDTFKALNCYLDGLIFRTNDHRKLKKASSFFKKPIINALSDRSHPCQILSDLFTLKEHFGSLNLNILWIGDMNNVCFSLIEAANLIEEINLTICTPEEIFNSKDWKINEKIIINFDFNQIDFNNFDCIMTDVFISMNDKVDHRKVKLLQPYMIDKATMSKTNESCVFMHCLPAKVGYEVTEDVINSKKSIVWKQAYNRMIAQKKIFKFIKWN